MGHNKAAVVLGVAGSFHAADTQFAKSNSLKIVHGILVNKSRYALQSLRAPNNFQVRSRLKPLKIASNMIWVFMCWKNMRKPIGIAALKLTNNSEWFFEFARVDSN